MSVETEKKDRYGRTVGKVVIDGRNVNPAMVLAGTAWHYNKYDGEQSQTDRLLYADAEREAQEARRGLWVQIAPIEPWIWRGSKRLNSPLVKSD